MICGKMPVNQTDKYISDLEVEIQYLKKLLDENGISYDYEAHLRALQSDVGDVVFPELGPEHASLLYSYFKGRRDVYALRARNGQDYTLRCRNNAAPLFLPVIFWKSFRTEISHTGQSRRFNKGIFQLFQDYGTDSRSDRQAYRLPFPA